MEERKRMVLRAVVDDYVATAEPVGSRTIARKYGLGVSPATIRNEMADLEEQGYLEQPHTSAGRVPSSKGYRYYVDYLLSEERLDEGERVRLRAALAQHAHETAALLQHAVRLLSAASGYLVMISGPDLARSTCRFMQFVPLRPGRAFLVLVTENGLARNMLVELDERVTADELRQASEALSQRFRGWALRDVEEALASGMLGDLGRYREVLARAVVTLCQQIEADDRHQVYLGGATNLLKQPEFRDVDKVWTLLNALEEGEVGYELLHGWSRDDGDVMVAIGEELGLDAVRMCSLVSGGYRLCERPVGRIGVLGPSRMDYARVRALVEEVTRGLTEILTERLA